MILTISQRKQSTQDRRTYLYICLYWGVLHSSEDTKTESEGGSDINDVNVEQRRNNFELIEIVVERINVKTQKLNLRTLGKIHNNKDT